ncbi:hypothetical protein CK220_10565 [Mesorhizobium sp. WSM3860]|nr:hypothetical protein CK220_10565 [Mesorhizobium sp. WSM3860]
MPTGFTCLTTGATRCAQRADRNERGWQVVGPLPTVQDVLVQLRPKRLRCSRGELVTGSQKRERRGFPFAVGSAYDVPERVCGKVLAAHPTPADRREAVPGELTGASCAAEAMSAGAIREVEFH